MKMAVGFFRIHCFAVMTDTADRKIGATDRVEGLPLLTADSAAVLFGEWALHKNRPLEYSNGTTWDRMLQQGIQLLERSHKMTAFVFANRRRTCRSSSRGRSHQETISLPTWTRSGVSTVFPACWWKTTSS